jgi:hypothetical protein
MKRKTLIPAILFLLGAFRLFGVDFNGLVLSNDDRLLFNTEFETQNTLFVSRLTDLSMQQLTAYPE